MASEVFYCRCGQVFRKRVWLVEHVGICNPGWPRVTPEDKHKVITREEWEAFCFTSREGPVTC